ncbi:B-cell lymphoma 3 protein-like [Argonauta hians]
MVMTPINQRKKDESIAVEVLTNLPMNIHARTKKTSDISRNVSCSPPMRSMDNINKQQKSLISLTSLTLPSHYEAGGIKSNLPYLDKETMRKNFLDSADSLFCILPYLNDKKTYLLKKINVKDIPKISNENRSLNFLDLCGYLGDSTNSKLPAPPTARTRVLLQMLDNISYTSLTSYLEQFNVNSLEERSNSSLPLKKRKISNSKPHNTNISLVTGGKANTIVILPCNQLPLSSGKDEKIKKNIEIALKQDEDGDLPLHRAVAHKNLPVITTFCKLIQQGGKTVDRFNKKKFTPLHLCVKINFIKGVRKLIKMGADVNLSDGYGNSALHLAVSSSHLECLDVILKTDSPSECRKPNLDTRNYEGLTPLHTAVQMCNIEMIRQLLEAGANPDSKDYKSGQTPLFFAVENHHEDIIKVLLENDASVDIKNFAGFTPFLVSNGRKYQEICKLLINWGADAHGIVFDDLTSDPKTSNVKNKLKTKLSSSLK